MRPATTVRGSRLAHAHHGSPPRLRVGGLVDLRWTDIHFESATLHVRRLKGSNDSTQPIQGDTLRALRKLHREAPAGSAFVFLSERGAPFTTDGFRKLLKRAAAAAGLAHLNANPHGLRHGCGHKLAEQGTDTRTIQDYLGHEDIRQTAQYTAHRCGFGPVGQVGLEHQGGNPGNPSARAAQLASW